MNWTAGSVARTAMALVLLLALTPHGAGAATGETAGAGVAAGFDGLAQSGDGSGQTADLSTAMGPATVVEAVDGRLAAFTRSGYLRCQLGLDALFGAPNSGAHPRVQYDRRYDRFSVAAVPRDTGQPSTSVYLATTRRGDPCAAWDSYRFEADGAAVTPSAQADRVSLGQDPAALLLAVDLFDGGRVTGAVAFAVPKAAAYGGVRVDVPMFDLAGGAAPVSSTDPADDSYYLAAVPGDGYLLYRMVNSVGPGTVVVLDGAVAAPFEPPSRRVRQCVDPPLQTVDWRVGLQPVRVGDYAWFAHDIDAAGRPGVRYGALNLYSHRPYLATAAQSPTSDDFSPSIGVRDAGSDLSYVVLSWAYTDAAPAQPCTDVSVVADRIPPGTGVPDRLGTGVVLARGGPGTLATSPGRFTSIDVEPDAAVGCPRDRALLTAQLFFAPDGRWRTRLTQVDFC